MLRRAVTFCAFVCAMFAASAAHAEPESRVGVDWGRIIQQIDRFARTGSEQLTPLPSTMHEEHTNQLYLHNAGNAWFGVAPSVTLVARNWGEAYRLAGDRMSLVDALRLSASTRMVMTRVRLSNTHVSRVTPFAQLGIGQWRVDRELMPRTPSYTEVATQVGGGFEIQISSKWQIAYEAASTMFIRAERDADNLPSSPRLWSTTLASRLSW